MKFNRERGIRRESPKKDVLALEPSAYSQFAFEINGDRRFYICVENRTLSKAISASKAWSLALKVLQSERP